MPGRQRFRVTVPARIVARHIGKSSSKASTGVGRRRGSTSDGWWAPGRLTAWMRPALRDRLGNLGTLPYLPRPVHASRLGAALRRDASAESALTAAMLLG